MDTNEAVGTLSALSQPTRLEVFRLLMRNEPHGLPAGEIARQIEIPHNTMSTHLAILERAELLASHKQGRSVIYRVRLPAVHELVVYLLRDCCNGKPELCTPLIEELSICCNTQGGDCAGSTKPAKPPHRNREALAR